MLDFMIVTSLLHSDPMATELECGYIGLDIVDQMHGVELHSMYWQEEPYWQLLISYMGWFVGVV